MMAQPTHCVLFSGPSLLEKSAFIPANEAAIPILRLGGWLFTGQAQANAQEAWLFQPDCSPSSLCTQPPAVWATALLGWYTPLQVWARLTGNTSPSNLLSSLLGASRIQLQQNNQCLVLLQLVKFRI